MEGEFPKPQESLVQTRIGRKVLVPILVLIFLGGFAGVLASRIWDPLWNPFRPGPEEVMEKMISEMEKVKTSQGKMEFSLIGSNEGRLELRLDLEGKADFSQPEKPRSEGSFSVIFEAGNGVEDKFALVGEMKNLDETSYLKLTTLLSPFFPMSCDPSQIKDCLADIYPDPSQLKNQWLKIDRASIIDLLNLMLMGMVPPEMEKIIQMKIQEGMKKILTGKKLYLVKEELPDEKIDETKVYHYLVSLNKEEILNIIPEIGKVIEETMWREYGIAPTKEKIKEVLDKVGEIEGEIWIGKKDYLLYRLKGEKSIDLSKFDEKGTVSIKFNLENSQFNQPVKIEAPSEYKDLAEVLAPLFGEESRLKAKDARIIADVGQVRVIAEFIYYDEDSYKNLCSGLTLNENHPHYGSDLGIIEKGIKEQQGGILNLSCYSSKESYCLAVGLVSAAGKYCLDSSGVTKEIGQDLNCLGDGTSKNPYRCPETPSKMKFPMKEPSFFPPLS
jgi:hypothetical protein